MNHIKGLTTYRLTDIIDMSDDLRLKCIRQEIEKFENEELLLICDKIEDRLDHDELPGFDELFTVPTPYTLKKRIERFLTTDEA